MCGGAWPAVLCKTGLFKFIESQDFKSAKTLSITQTMSGMLRILIRSRIFLTDSLNISSLWVFFNYYTFIFSN